MQYDSDHQMRRAHQLRNLVVFVTFVVSQHKHLSRGGSQTSHCLSNEFLQLTIDMLGLRVLGGGLK